MSFSNPYGVRSNGKGHGDVPTDPIIVKYMLDLVGYTATKDLSEIFILEPSCGEGEFIVEIANRIKESSKRYGFNAQKAFKTCVFGYDIIADKIEKCKQRLGLMGIDAEESNIKVGDFLTAKLPEMDVVVGNPPYVRYENIPKLQQEYIKRVFPTFHYRADLYIPFFEKTLRLLKPQGKHCFICANRWLKNEYGKKLRALVTRCFRLEMIIDLENANVFEEEVLAYPAITLISNNLSDKSFEYAEVDDVTKLLNLETQKRMAPLDEDWSTVFNTIEKDHLYGIEELGFKIGIGVATGADNVFISKDLPNIVENELLLPAINAKNLKGNELNWNGEYLFNPYSNNGELIDLSNYPLAEKYLLDHKKKLVERHVARKNSLKWYKTIDRITPQLKSEAKILLPDMSGNSFIFVDDGLYYPLHNLYYITGSSVKNLKILSAILMSDIIRKQICSITNNMNGGFPRWQSQYLRKLKVPYFIGVDDDLCNRLVESYERRDYNSINLLVGKMYEAKQTDNSNLSKHRMRVLAQNKNVMEPELEFDFK